ncbi:MAG: AAA family ATPase, partial [Promethearchaeota archaeon]
MLVKRLMLTEFRGIKKCFCPIELSSFTVLIGRNNSGKSTILEALSLFPDPMETEYLSNSKRIEFILRLHRNNKGTDFSPLIYRYTGVSRLNYEIERLRDIYTIEINKNGIKYIWNQGNIVPQNMFQEDYNDFKKVLFIPNDSEIIKKLENKMKDLQHEIEKRNIHIEVAEKLNKCIDDKYSEINLYSDHIRIRKVFSKGSANIILRDLGNGAERALKIMALTEIINPKL